MNVKVIAEIGINHNGDMDMVKRLIEEGYFVFLVVCSYSFYGDYT